MKLPIAAVAQAAAREPADRVAGSPDCCSYQLRKATVAHRVKPGPVPLRQLPPLLLSRLLLLLLRQLRVLWAEAREARCCPQRRHRKAGHKARVAMQSPPPQSDPQQSTPQQ